MKRGSVRIDALRLRAPGLTREEARQLGDATARGLDALSRQPVMPGRIARLSLRVQSHGPVSAGQIADAIVTKISQRKPQA